MQWRKPRDESPITATPWLWVAVALSLGALALAIGVLAVSYHSYETYFRDLPLSASEKQRFGQYLAAMEEPELGGADALRLLYLPSFDHPIMVRYELRGQQTLRRSVRLSGVAGYQPGEVAFDKTDRLPSTEFAQTLQAFRQAGVWSLPARESINGRDGSLLVVETFINGRHRAIVRWSPEYDSQARGLTALDRAYRETFEKSGLRLPPP